MHAGLPAPELLVSRWFRTSEPLTLAALRGRPVLLHAFQMLCPGCVSHAVPQAEKAHRLFGPQGLVVLGLHTVFEHHEAMTPVSLEAFLHEYRVTHPVGVDTAGTDRNSIPLTMRAWAMQGTPTLVLIDRGGMVRLNHFGQVDDLQLGVLIGRLLAESSPVTAPIPIGDNSPIEGSCEGGSCTPPG